LENPNSPSCPDKASPCVVGIGASAGGLESLKLFFTAMPSDSGLAFVVIQHLDPTHKSLTAELLSRFTQMRVGEAEEGMRVEPDHVYTLPPKVFLSIDNGVLHLESPPDPRHSRLPIDHFFNSLGQDQREKAIAVILSGSGSDGSQGIQSIAANGGIVLAQDPLTAQFDNMILAAISTGLVWQTLPVEDMPTSLIGYAAHPGALGGTNPLSGEEALEAVNNIILARHGCNFADYKRSTLARRIQRRMGLHGLMQINDYVELLRRSQEEADALFKDMQIGVTEFFRDPEAWRKLETEAIAPLVESKRNGEAIRAWVAGCATGQEAYSLAMLLLDQLSRIGKCCPVQVFGTDTNEDALQAARAGSYPEAIEKQVPPELLARFFLPKDGEGCYLLTHEVRDAVVFGRHNLFSDPPFSRLDIITCRNLLIYLEPPIQQKAIGLFHFVLRPGGYLFLGSAETAGQREDLFKPIVKKWRIYRQIAVGRKEKPTLLPNPEIARLNVQWYGGTRGVPRMSEAARLAQQMLLDEFTAPAVLVNQKNEVLYFCGSTEKFLSRPHGVPTQDILVLAREGLRSRLRNALVEAADSGLTVLVDDAKVKHEGVFHPVMLTVKPVASARLPEQLLLVVFEDRPSPSSTLMAGTGEGEESALVRRLEEELRVTEADLQSTIQRLEISNEELSISNEEVVSINEELQSSNEELETSMEELQSLNEELSTVNHQLQAKVTELEATNNDMKNLLVSSEFATLCLDHELRIKWFTPALAGILNILPIDVGRPIGHLATGNAGQGLFNEAEAVLQSFQPKQKELQVEDRRWFIRRLLPYHSDAGRVEGVIATFTDISESKRMAAMSIEAKKSQSEILEQMVAERTRQLRMVADELELAEDRERRKLAEALHDDLGQVLAIAKIKLTSMNLNERRGNLKIALKEIGDLIGQANESMRSLAFQMSPLVLLDQGLAEAAECLADEMCKKYGLSVAIHDDGEPKPLSEATKNFLFRSLRELLVNAAKHSGVLVAEVSLLREDAIVVVTVSDHGKGFDPTNDEGKAGFGLSSIRNRIGYTGGKMQIESYPGVGTTITLTAPLEIEVLK
jgi:two-component system CheB/CheR fusion protein